MEQEEQEKKKNCQRKKKKLKKKKQKLERKKKNYLQINFLFSYHVLLHMYHAKQCILYNPANQCCNVPC